MNNVKIISKHILKAAYCLQKLDSALMDVGFVSDDSILNWAVDDLTSALSEILISKTLEGAYEDEILFLVNAVYDNGVDVTLDNLMNIYDKASKMLKG